MLSRINLLDIAINSNEIHDDARVCNALCRPAQYMRIFAIRNENLRSKKDSTFHQTARFFANNAPSLTHFSVGGLYNLLPIPAILRTGLLQHLTMYPLPEILALHFLAACAQLPGLKELQINIAYLTLEAPQDPVSVLPSSLQVVSLPELRSISITSLSMPRHISRISAVHHFTSWMSIGDNSKDHATKAGRYCYKAGSVCGRNTLQDCALYVQYIRQPRRWTASNLSRTYSNSEQVWLFSLPYPGA